MNDQHIAKSEMEHKEEQKMEHEQEQQLIPLGENTLDSQFVQASLPASIMEKVLMSGDLSPLSTQERLFYYKAVCESVGLNPLTKPFDYMTLEDDKNQRRLVLYPNKSCAEQLRDKHGVSLTDLSSQVVEGIYIVRVRGKNRDGREDEASGAVPLEREGGEWKTSNNGKRYLAKDGTMVPLSPLDKANAMLKAETKAKRRLTLSLCGLGLNPLHKAVAVEFEDMPILALASMPAPPPSNQEDGSKKRELMGKIVVAAKAAPLSIAEIRAYCATRFEQEDETKLREEQLESLLEEIRDGTVKQFFALPTAEGAEA